MKKIVIIILLLFSIVYIFSISIKESKPIKEELLHVQERKVAVTELIKEEVHNRVKDKILTIEKSIPESDSSVGVFVDNLVEIDDHEEDSEEEIEYELSENLSSLEEISEEEMAKNEIEILDAFAYYEFEAVSYDEEI